MLHGSLSLVGNPKKKSKQSSTIMVEKIGFRVLVIILKAIYSTTRCFDSTSDLGETMKEEIARLTCTDKAGKRFDVDQVSVEINNQIVCE